MLAIDTNLIVRYLVGDDAAQALRAKRLIDNNDVFVCLTVLLETEWVLRSVYEFSASQCARALGAFAGLPRVTVEDASAAAKALAWMDRAWISRTACIWRRRKAAKRSSASTASSRQPRTHLAE